MDGVSAFLQTQIDANYETLRELTGLLIMPRPTPLRPDALETFSEDPVCISLSGPFCSDRSGHP